MSHLRRMTWFLAGTLALCNFAAAPAWSQTVSPEEQQQGFVSLFNGQDFTGWRFGEGPVLPDQWPDNWKVADGVIRLSGGGKPHLGSQWDYDDFDFRFEWRSLAPRYNSGFFIRSGRNVGSNQINLAKGGEGRFFGGKMTGGPAVPELQKEPLQWNLWRVLAEGSKITFWCNDQLAWEGTEFQGARGYLGLQAEGAPLEFRNLRIRELNYQPLGDFDGSVSETKLWQVADAVPGGWQTRESWGDFQFRLEWKAESGGQLAIGCRGPTAEAALVRLGDRAEGSGAVGAADAKPAKKSDYPLGQWNFLELKLVGPQLTVWQNGAIVADLKLPEATAAPKSPLLIMPGTKVQFRQMRIRPLKSV